MYQARREVQLYQYIIYLLYRIIIRMAFAEAACPQSIQRARELFLGCPPRFVFPLTEDLPLRAPTPTHDTHAEEHADGCCLHVDSIPPEDRYQFRAYDHHSCS